MKTKTSKSALVVMILTFLGFGLGYVNIFFVLPKFLSEEELGAYKVLFDLSYLIYPFLQFGGVNIINKFFFDQTEEGKKYLLSFSSLLFFSGLLIFVPFFVAFDQSILDALGFGVENYKPELKWIICGLILVIGGVNLLGSHLRNYSLLIGFNFFNSIWLRITVTIAFVLFGFVYIDFNESLILLLGLVALGFIALLIHAVLKTNLRLIPKLSEITTSRSSMLSYGAVMLIGFGSTVFISKIDTIMTGGIIGLSFAGIYSVAIAFSSIIEVPRRAINQVLIPHVSKAFSEDNIGKIEDVYKESSITMFFMSSFLFLGLILNIDDLLTFLPNAEVYKAGKWVVIILSLAKVFDAIWGINSEILILSKYYKLNIVLLVFLLFTTVGLNLIFINDELLITGTAIATGITVVLYNSARGIILYWKYKIQPFTKSHLLVFIAITVATLICLLIESMAFGIWVNLFFKSLVVTVVFGISFFMFPISRTLDKFKEGLLEKFNI